MKIGEITEVATIRINGTYQELLPKGVFPTSAIALDRLDFIGGSYRMSNGTTKVLPTLSFLHFFITDFSNEKEIIRTSVRDLGVIQEFWNLNPYQIRIQGKIVSEFDTLYPKDKLDAFFGYNQVAEGINIRHSELNNNPKINKVILKSFNFGNKQNISQIPFTMDLESCFDDIIDFSSFLTQQ